MATVTAFIRTTKSDKNKPVNVRFRLRDGRDYQLFHKSNFLVIPDKWDITQQKIKAKVLFDERERKEFNKAISERKDLIHSIYVQSGKALTTEILETEIDKALNPEKYETQPKIKSLFQWTAYFIETAPTRKDKNTGRLLSHNNIQQYKACEKHLREFAKSRRKEDFEFANIDQTFYDKFVAFMQEKQFTQNSVGKQIKVIKTMLNEATQQGFNTNTNYSNFHVFTEDIDNIYLNEDELQQLKDTDLSKTPYLDRVRDWFLLLAWTGCRFSDLEKITKSDIKDGFITFRQQKTNTKVVIPVHPIVVEALEKYEYNLPEAITNQKFNEYIKEACRIAEINSKETTTRTVGGKLVTEQFEKWEHVSTHTGRRSFCTNMYKRGLPTLTIMKISGHKTEKSFLKYIKVTEQEHAEIMAKAWKEIYKK